MLDEGTASVDARFDFAAVVGHELAHQWFGDLVTMPWWDDLWLNEAFATWMQPRLVAAVRPDLHPEVRALESVHAAMNADSLFTARKIRQEIADDSDIDSAFDSITYDKGGAVLSMFERWIGPEVFQKGDPQLPRRPPLRHRRRGRSAHGALGRRGARRGRAVPHLPRSARAALRRGERRLRRVAAARAPAVTLPPPRLQGPLDGGFAPKPRRPEHLADPRVRPLRRRQGRARGVHAPHRPRGRAPARRRVPLVGDAQRGRRRLLPLVPAAGRREEARRRPPRSPRDASG